MKKFYSSLFLLFATFLVKAQQVPNGDFEFWTNHGAFSNPVSWNTTDSIASTFGQHSVLQETGMVHSGSSAMKMQTWTYNSFFIEPAVASNGNLDISTGIAIIGGTPDSTRHDMLTGWYILTPANGDTAFVSVLLTRWNGASRDTVGTGKWSAYNAAASYTQFSLQINYVLSGNPDTVLIVIGTAALGINTGHAGTILYIDDLSFSGINGIQDLNKDNYSFNAYPNPASDFLTIEANDNAPVKGSISILDIGGKVLQKVPLTDKRQRININALANGNYFYELIDEKGTKFYSGKFSVSH